VTQLPPEEEEEEEEEEAVVMRTKNCMNQSFNFNASSFQRNWTNYLYLSRNLNSGV
jgi:hypothetical protein